MRKIKDFIRGSLHSTAAVATIIIAVVTLGLHQHPAIDNLTDLYKPVAHVMELISNEIDDPQDDSEEVAALPFTPAAGMLTKAEFTKLFLDSPWDPDQLENALTVVGCESNFDPKAKNPKSSARGLFQVLGDLHLEFLQERGIIIEPDDLYDPPTNILAAHALYEDAERWHKDGGWGPWVCKA